MKRLINSFTLTLAMIALFASCKKDIGYLQLDTDNPNLPVLTASESNIVLVQSRENNTAVIFEWTKPAFNFNGAFNYTLQLDSLGRNFSNPVNVPTGTDSSYAYNELTLNNVVKSLGFIEGQAGFLEIRVKAVLDDSVEVLYSNPITITVTPYVPAITDQVLYVPGGYQGWNPASAEIIRSKELNNIYEGYIYYTVGQTEFKFTDQPDWSHGVYGDAGEGMSGEIASPGNNFKVPTSGYYRLNADLTANTWSSTYTTWGIIGSATPNGWDADQDMVYDEGSKTWKVTLNLSAGEAKFRANDDWGINFGDDGSDGLLEYNGANISITEAGNYTVTFDLSNPWFYSYSFQKN